MIKAALSVTLGTVGAAGRRLMACFVMAGLVAIPVAPLMAGDSGQAANDQARTEAARAAAMALGAGLKDQLSAALKSSGPVAAVQVCKTIAPALSADAAKTHDFAVGRTALKVRNPDNAPDAFEARILKDFVTRIAAGEDAAKVEHSETVLEDGVRMFRYMKAIPMAAQPCLVCHGETLTPELSAEIGKLYPEDQATGFKAGELRGAFTVIQLLGNEAADHSD